MFSSKKNRITDSDIEIVSPPGERSPYQAAKEEWNERYGDYIAQARNWRIAAIMSLALAFLLAAGCVYIGAQSKRVPYIVEVDKIGQVVNVAYAEKSEASNPRLIQGMLKRFIVDFRNVSSDPVVQKQATDRLYKMVPEGAPSLERINAYYKENSPFVLGQTGTVQVELIGNPLPASDKSWQIEWYETKRTNTGAVMGKPVRYKAIITIAIYTPNDDQVLDLDNPIGLYVSELNWSQQL